MYSIKVMETLELIFNYIGTVGALFILLAFAMNQSHRWNSDSRIYDTVNLLGSFMLLLYALFILSWPFIITNAVWAGVSLRDVIKKQQNIKREVSKS